MHDELYYLLTNHSLACAAELWGTIATAQRLYDYESANDDVDEHCRHMNSTSRN